MALNQTIMIKSDLIEKVAKDTGLEKNKISRVFASLMENIKVSLTKIGGCSEVRRFFVPESL